MSTPLDKALLFLLCLTVILSGYITFAHIFFGTEYSSYDSWIFGMNLALLIQLYDSIYHK